MGVAVAAVWTGLIVIRLIERIARGSLGVVPVRRIEVAWAWAADR